MAFRLLFESKLRCKRQFDYVFQGQKRLYARWFLAYYRYNQQSLPRLGIIISKRNVRLAVQRNRIRRLIKEQFRLKQAVLPPIDIVFVVKKGSGNNNNSELRSCLLKLMRKLSTLRNEP